MATDLIKLLEEKMQDYSLRQVDPNTQTVRDENEQSGGHLFNRAVMAAALAGVFQYTRDEKNAAALIAEENTKGLPDRIFNHSLPELEKGIASYSHYPAKDTNKKMENILTNIVAIIKEQAGTDPKAVKNFMSAQRTSILAHLPAEINAGQLLKDGSLDDRMNKMHGPFSDFTHWLERIFSNSDK